MGNRRCARRRGAVIAAFVATGIATALAVTGSGCAISYTDRDSGTVHLFGFGHLSVRTGPPVDDKMPEAKTAAVLGLGLGLDEEDFSLSVGYSRRQRVRLVDADTAVGVDATGLLVQIPPSANRTAEREEDR